MGLEVHRFLYVISYYTLVQALPPEYIEVNIATSTDVAFLQYLKKLREKNL